MKKKTLVFLAGLAAAAVFPAAYGAGPESFTVKTARDVSSGWPQAASRAAGEMLAKYGAPDGITSGLLTWHDAGPWLEIIVEKDVAEHNFPSPHKDALEQTIAYEVPEEKFSELARFDGSVMAGRTRGTLSSRSQSEAMNFLALNLSHDIITNRRSVEEAREMFADISAAYARGEQHPYTRGLRFIEADLKDTMDPDYSPG